MEKNRYLDYLKTIAITLVVCGHFIGTGTYALDLPLLFSSPIGEALMPENTHVLESVGTFLYPFHISGVRIGLFIFFIISGYLGVFSREGKDARNFIYKKCIRIFPILAVCCLIMMVVIYFAQSGGGKI